MSGRSRTARRAVRIGKILLLVALPLASVRGGDGDRYAVARAMMVDQITSEIVRLAPEANDAAMRQALTAIGQVPREAFVPADRRADAYRERPLPIGYGQTISDAYIVAVMTAALGPGRHENVLDVGTGSGYQAAVLSLVSKRVSSIEIVAPLARKAAKRLARLGYRNVAVRAGDGYAGWRNRALFDGIIVAAGASEVPEPLFEQLSIGGRIVMPIGPSWATEQVLVVTKTGPASVTRCSLGWSMFVPFAGKGARAVDGAGIFADIPPCYSGPIARPDFVPANDPAAS